MEQQPSMSLHRAHGVAAARSAAIVCSYAEPLGRRRYARRLVSCALLVLLAGCARAAGTSSDPPTFVPVWGSLTPVTTPGPSPTADPASAGDEPSVDEIIDATIQNLRRGNFLFGSPNPMRAGESYRVVVRLTKELTPTAAFSSELPSGSEPQVEPVMLGTQMAVKLQGASPGIFDITPSEAVAHAVASKGYTEWQWEVRPLRSGSHRLEAIVSVRIPIPGQAEIETIDYDTLHREVSIDVNPLYTTQSLLRDYWGALALLAGGLGGLLAARWLRPDLVGGTQQRLLARRERIAGNIDKLLELAATYGGETYAPLDVQNQLEDARKELGAIDERLERSAPPRAK
jgi:hypothetical protein